MVFQKNIILFMSFLFLFIAPLSVLGEELEIFNDPNMTGGGTHDRSHGVCVYAHKPVIHIRGELLWGGELKPGERKRINIGDSGKFHVVTGRQGGLWSCEKVPPAFDGFLAYPTEDWPKFGHKTIVSVINVMTDYHENPRRITLKSMPYLMF